MKTFLIVLTALLVGCGTTGLVEDNDASYFLISKGEATGPASWFTGGVSFCKITQSNLGATDFLVDVKYDGESCTVEATSATKE